MQPMRSTFAEGVPGRVVELLNGRLVASDHPVQEQVDEPRRADLLARKGFRR